MNRIARLLPNTLTCLNLLFGCVAIVYAFQGYFVTAFWAVIVSVAFDFCDGFAARLLKVHSPLGKELDSLADMVSFGVAPSVVLFAVGMRTAESTNFVPFLIAIFSALRLAKFNLDPRQTTGFIGLPTPANALFFLALGYAFQHDPAGFPARAVADPVFRTVAVLVMSFLLVSEVPMFALKFKSYGWRGNEVRYSFLAFALVLLVLLGVTAIPYIILAYILYSLVKWLTARGKAE